MSTSPLHHLGREREPSFDVAAVRKIISDLLIHRVDDVESDQVEVKGWCDNEKELAEKISEACSCLANTSGGWVVVGASEGRGAQRKFSPCPYPVVSGSWLTNQVQNLTRPSVECSGHDVSGILSELLGVSQNNLFVMRVPKTRYMSSHLNSKGVSKKRIGKVCQPQFVAEDDRTRTIVPDATIEDLSITSIEWGISQHQKNRKAPTQWTDQSEFLAQMQLLDPFLLEEEISPRYRVSAAALLLFGKSAAITRTFPHFETLVIGPQGSVRLRKNIVDSVRDLCFGETPMMGSLAPQIPKEAIKELVVNAYIHRCYRTPAPVIIRASDQGLEIENPGELLTGLNVGNLIHGIPTYRNLLLAEGARFIGLCDKLGEGIDVVYRASLSGGLGFPEFESDNNRFVARIPVGDDTNFKEFIRRRAHVINQLDEIIVLRVLWGKPWASLTELSLRMERTREFGARILKELCKRSMVEAVPDNPSEFRLAPAVRGVIERIFQDDQMSFELSMWGDTPRD
jgi:predicted HTH transcriptional regulator